MSRRRARIAVVSAMVIMGSALPVARAEEHAVRVDAPWEGRARIYIMGQQQAFVLGVFAGRLAVDPKSSSLNGAQLVCPGAFDADYAAKANRGEGRCVITTGSGERLFARWTCTGEPDKGCAGRFVFTGGTGAYQGVTGEGALALRLTLTEMTHLEQVESDYDVKGLASWPALRYRTP
jgi:hypothetical protein